MGAFALAEIASRVHEELDAAAVGIVMPKENGKKLGGPFSSFVLVAIDFALAH